MVKMVSRSFSPSSFDFFSRTFWPRIIVIGIITLVDPCSDGNRGLRSGTLGLLGVWLLVGIRFGGFVLAEGLRWLGEDVETFLEAALAAFSIVRKVLVDIACEMAGDLGLFGVF